MDPTLEPEPGETLNVFLKRGGRVGALKNKGIVWDEDSNSWITQRQSTDELYQKYLDSLKKK